MRHPRRVATARNDPKNSLLVIEPSPHTRSRVPKVKLAGPMSHFRASLGSLPPELIEEVIIICTLFGDPRAPSTFARTCRLFRTLVYHQRQKHLWREVFLVFFDDPWPAIGLRAHGRAPQFQLDSNDKGKGRSKNFLVSHGFPWEREYKLRIWTESFILKRTRPPPVKSTDVSSDLPSTDADVHAALDTLLRVVLTASQLPYDSMASHYYPPTLPHQPPIISPLLLAAHTQPSIIPDSLNTNWLARVLAHGLPRVLMARLTSFDENGNIDVQKKPVKWDGLLMKLVAQVGLMTPISAETRDHSEAGGDNEHVTPDCRNLEQETDEVKSTATSHDGVRRQARVRVYNIAYVHKSRGFGPFLPLEAQYASYSSPLATQNLGSAEEPLANTRRFGSPSNAVPPVPPIPDANLNLESIEIPALDDSGGDDDNDEAQETEQGQETDEDWEDMWDDDVAGNRRGNDNAPIMVSINRNNAVVNALSAARGSCAPSVQVQGEQLPHFDWAWIAAARQVIEFNLRDLLKRDRHQAVLRAFLSLEGLRSCSAPGYQPSAAESESERTFEDGEGWDWAGVEGQWRRCLCWLDYRDLIGNNAKLLAERYGDPDLNEVMRIFPVTLRITHYSRAHPSWPGRPKIHFEGEMYLGSSVVVEPDPGIRRLEGTVQMAASGDVRWSMLSYRNERQNRWDSESVQIGGLGSAMGTIGLYTSAEHEGSDPIGPAWMWKVSPADVWPTLGANGRVVQRDPGWIGGTVDENGGTVAEEKGGAADEKAGPGPTIRLPQCWPKGDDGAAAQRE